MSVTCLAMDVLVRVICVPSMQEGLGQQVSAVSLSSVMRLGLFRP